MGSLLKQSRLRTPSLSDPHSYIVPVNNRSSSGCCYRDGLAAAEALQRYTGPHWLVAPPILAEVEYYSKYASAAYGVEPHSTQSMSKLRNLLRAMWQGLRKHSTRVTRSACWKMGSTCWKQINL